MCACAPAKLQSTQIADCWPDPKQHSGLFPTDKRGLASHIETGTIYCLRLQKTRNRNLRERGRLSRGVEASSGRKKWPLMTAASDIE